MAKATINMNKTIYQQIALTFQAETIKLLHLEDSYA